MFKKKLTGYIALTVMCVSVFAGGVYAQSPNVEVSKTKAKPVVNATTATNNTTKTISNRITNTNTSSSTVCLKSAAKKLRITYIDVGQGDSAFVELPNKKTMLIDAGESSEVSAVVKVLLAKKCKKINYLIGTHPHTDHIGGVETIIDTFKVGTVYLPKVNMSGASQTYKSMISRVKAKGLRIKTAHAGLKILNFKKKYGLTGQLVAPVKGKSYSNANDSSAVLRLTYKKRSFLFEGDAEALSEGEMLDSGYNLRSDVLKVGHHGSLSSTSAAFVMAVRPRLAIISVGSGNSYGHPRPETIKRLRQAGAKVLRTDTCGDISVVSNGRRITYRY